MRRRSGISIRGKSLPPTAAINVAIEPCQKASDQMACSLMLAIRYLPTTASKALGLACAIVSKVRAAPLGCLRPCSQP